MIISASRRTDIPAFYATWFMERIREGTVSVKNPFNPSQMKRVSLRPEDLSAIVFWTRDCHPMLNHLEELDHHGFKYLFLYTITGYGPPLEMYAPLLESAVSAFRKLSQRIGRERVIWRFDPVIYVEEQGEDWITSRFEKIATSLRCDTRRVIISFLDLYKKVIKRLTALEKTTGYRVSDISHRKETIRRIAIALAEIARSNNLEIYSCAEKMGLEGFGISPGKCIDGDLLNTIFGLHLKVEKDKNQRDLCNCTISQDIGEYDTCHHHCVYCYATGRGGTD